MHIENQDLNTHSIKGKHDFHTKEHYQKPNLISFYSITKASNILTNTVVSATNWCSYFNPTPSTVQSQMTLNIQVALYRFKSTPGYMKLIQESGDRSGIAGPQKAYKVGEDRSSVQSELSI